MSGSTITPSLSELVRETAVTIRALLYGTSEHNQMHDLYLSKLDELLPKLELSRLSSVGVGEEPLRPISRALRDDMQLQASLSPDGRLICTIDRQLWNDWAEAIGDLAVPVGEEDVEPRFALEVVEALRPFAEVMRFLDRMQADDRTAELSDTTIRVTGNGSSGGITLKEHHFADAEKAIRRYDFLQRSAATGSSNPIPPLDDGAVERELRDAAAAMETFLYGQMSIHYYPEWVADLPVVKCLHKAVDAALQAALEPQT